MIRCVFTFVD